jgi:RNA polymerase sigma factor (sigma-70 family)
MRRAIISVVDNDASTVRLVNACKEAMGAAWRVQAFTSAMDFLAAPPRTGPQCAVVELWLPGTNGLRLQRMLADQNRSVPLVFVADHADVQVAVQVMEAGAVTLLEKPVPQEELGNAILKGLQRDMQFQLRQARRADLKNRLNRLTVKEHEVLELILDGKSNRQIAGVLHLSVRTVEDRRARLMKKLEVRSLVELIKTAMLE